MMVFIYTGARRGQAAVLTQNRAGGSTIQVAGKREYTDCTTTIVLRSDEVCPLLALDDIAIAELST